MTSRATTRFTCPNPTVISTGLSSSRGRLSARAHRHTTTGRSSGRTARKEITTMPSSAPRLHSVHAVCTVTTEPNTWRHGANRRAAKGG